MRSSSDVAGRHPGKGSEKRVRQNREGTALLVELCGRYAPVPAASSAATPPVETPPVEIDAVGLSS